MKNYWDGENWLKIFKTNCLIEYYLNGKKHRKDGPSRIWYDRKGFIGFEQYYLNDKRHRKDGPALIHYYDDNSVNLEAYCFNDKKHRKDGPAILHYNRDKTIRYQRYFFKGKLIILKNLPFEMPIDTDEKEFYMNLIYGE